MPHEAMLDASMMLDEEISSKLADDFRNRIHKPRNLRIASSLVGAIEDNRSLESLLEFYSLQGHTQVLQRNLRICLEAGLATYSYQGSIDYPARYRFRDSTNEVIAQILFDEWEFLIHHSWLFAKLRKTFDKFVEIGAIGVEYSGEKFDAAVRATLKIPQDQPVTPNERAGALSKWIAVASPAITLATIAPPLVAAIGVGEGIFWLMDP